MIVYDGGGYQDRCALIQYSRGWEAFFDKIAVFLRESGRQFGNCSENFANYAIERLEICIITVSRLKAHLENGAVLVQPQYHEVVTGYKNSMESLVTYLRSLSAGELD